MAQTGESGRTQRKSTQQRALETKKAQQRADARGYFQAKQNQPAAPKPRNRMDDEIARAPSRMDTEIAGVNTPKPQQNWLQQAFGAPAPRPMGGPGSGPRGAELAFQNNQSVSQSWDNFLSGLGSLSGLQPAGRGSGPKGADLALQNNIDTMAALRRAFGIDPTSSVGAANYGQGVPGGRGTMLPYGIRVPSVSGADFGQGVPGGRGSILPWYGTVDTSGSGGSGGSGGGYGGGGGWGGYGGGGYSNDYQRWLRDMQTRWNI